MILKETKKYIIKGIVYNNWKHFGTFNILPALIYDLKLRGKKQNPNKVYIISLAWLIFRAEISLEVYS